LNFLITFSSSSHSNYTLNKLFVNKKIDYIKSIKNKKVRFFQSAIAKVKDRYQENKHKIDIKFF